MKHIALLTTLAILCSSVRVFGLPVKTAANIISHCNAFSISQVPDTNDLAPSGSNTHEDETLFWVGRTEQSVPQGAKVTLQLDRSQYFLGENVLVHFILHNTSDTPFEFSQGHDYRGASRHLRFKVTAIDENGQIAQDPDPNPNCFGGLGGPQTLKPGQTYTQSLPLMRYCDIVKPGVYTITATHDFGWKEDTRKRPVGQTIITFRMPDSAQAEQIVSEMANLPDRSDHTIGERSDTYADFTCLRHPVFLDILVKRAQDGDMRVFEGLGKIPTVNATKALIQLAGNLKGDVALQAAKTLNNRLLYPDSHYVPAKPGSTQTPLLTIRGRLVKQAWDESLVDPVRVAARKLLKSEDLSTVAAGAFMFTCIGKKEDASLVLTAINNSRNPTHNPRTDPKDNILDMPQPIRELLQAMDALKTRGYSMGQHVSGDAEILVYFHFLKGDPSPRPEHYNQFLEAFGIASWPLIREAAVDSVPAPIPPEHKDFIAQRLEDKDLGVCRAACIAAGKSGDPTFLQPLLDIIAAEQHEWLLHEASNAAQKLGGGYNLLSVWVDRLPDEHLCGHALDTLQTVLEVPGSYSGQTVSRQERLELRNAWREFLTLHADEIKAGKRFKLSDPAVKPVLVGRARSWQMPDGTSWP